MGAVIGDASFARALTILADGGTANPTGFVGTAKDVMFTPHSKRGHACFAEAGADFVGDGETAILKTEPGDGARRLDDGAHLLVGEVADEGAGVGLGEVEDFAF